MHESVEVPKSSLTTTNVMPQSTKEIKSSLKPPPKPADYSTVTAFNHQNGKPSRPFSGIRFLKNEKMEKEKQASIDSGMLATKRVSYSNAPDGKISLVPTEFDKN